MNEISPPLTKHEQIFTAGNALAMHMMAALDDYRQRKRTGNWDHSANNWASQIHHPCLKQLVHKRVDWASEKLPDIHSLYRFEEGDDTESLIKEKLMKVGYELNEAQRRITIPEYKISGKIDGLLPLHDGLFEQLPPGLEGIKGAPVEIKSVGPHFWESTKTVKDILAHPKFWIQGIPSQLNLYLHALGYPFGLLILKTFGKRWRILPLILDGELLHADFMKAKAVNEHVEAGTYPEPIPFDSSICGLCGFTHMNCHPLMATGFKELSEAETAELGLFVDLQDQFNALKKQYETWKDELIGNQKEPGRYFGQCSIQDNIEISTSVQNRKRLIEGKKAEMDELKSRLMEQYELIITKIDRV